jgi:hypothetical protein
MARNDPNAAARFRHDIKAFAFPDHLVKVAA